MIISKFFKCPKALPLFSYKNEKKKKGVGVVQKPLLFWEKKRVWKLCQNTLPLFSKKEEKNFENGGGGTMPWSPQ